MKRHWLIAVFLIAAFPAQAASLDERWENLKLRAYPLTRFFSDQGQALGDIRAQGLDPKRHTRIDLADLVSGGPPKDGIPSLTYDGDRRLLFPVRGQQQLTLHPKTIVSYAWSPAVATPVGRFAGASAWVAHQRLLEAGELDIAFGKGSLKARWNPDLETAEFFDANGARVLGSTAFAFVYPAFFR